MARFGLTSEAQIQHLQTFLGNQAEKDLAKIPWFKLLFQEIQVT